MKKIKDISIMSIEEFKTLVPQLLEEIQTLKEEIRLLKEELARSKKSRPGRR